jgi:hypothetical protein
MECASGFCVLAAPPHPPAPSPDSEKRRIRRGGAKVTPRQTTAVSSSGEGPGVRRGNDLHTQKSDAPPLPLPARGGLPADGGTHIRAQAQPVRATNLGRCQYICPHPNPPPSNKKRFDRGGSSAPPPVRAFSRTGGRFAGRVAQTLRPPGNLSPGGRVTLWGAYSQDMRWL